MDDAISATQMEGVGRQRIGTNARVKPCCLGATSAVGGAIERIRF